MGVAEIVAADAGRAVVIGYSGQVPREQPDQDPKGLGQVLAGGR